MSDTQGFTAAPPLAVADSAIDVRFDFMKTTYSYLLGGIGAFIALQTVLFMTSIPEMLVNALYATSGLLILGLSFAGNFLVSATAKSRSRQSQLGWYGAAVVVEVILFAPILWLAFEYADGAVASAAAVSVVGFLGLSGVAITSAKDFSFLQAGLKWAGIMSLVAIGASVIFGLSLGTWFSVAMVALIGGIILFTTQRILRTYPEGTEVIAAAQLFSSVMTMFFYVLRFFMSRD